MKPLKLYLAGKVNPTETVGKNINWRDIYCQKLSALTGYEIINLDPTKKLADFDLNENDPQLVFGRDCFMIKSADIVIVNLTDDISVGGSQEMLIAKYFGKPLIGIAPKEGKFNRTEKIIQEKLYRNYLNAFVAVPCDVVVSSFEETALSIKTLAIAPPATIKNIQIIEQALNYYQDHHYPTDTYLHKL